MYDKNEENINEVNKYIFNLYPKISTGLDHYACIAYSKKKPSVYCWGGNSSNQLGVGIHIRYCEKPTVVNFFENFIACSVCCTHYSTYVLVKENLNDEGCFVYSFGKGNNGLLGYRKHREIIDDTKSEINQKNEKEKKGKYINKNVLNAFGISAGVESSISSATSLMSFDYDRISSDRKSEHSENKKEDNHIELSENSQDSNSTNSMDKDSIRDIKINENKNEGINQDDKTKEEKADWFTPVPVKIRFPEYTKIKYISCGDMHILAISTDGILYGWGSNSFGCVGNGTYTNVYEPTRIYLEKRSIKNENESNPYQYKFYNNSKENNYDYLKNCVIHCSAGSKHSLACTLNGDIYSWGFGGNGRLGLGDIKNYNTPQIINKLRRRRKIIFVCAGVSHSSCVDTDYNVYTWGSGKFYKLGHGNDTDLLYPKKIEFFNFNKKIFMLSSSCFNSIALNINGDVYIWGTFNISKNGSSTYICKTPKQINTNYKCIYVHASTYLPFGITLVGDLIMFGNNYYKNINNNDIILDNADSSLDSDDNVIEHIVEERKKNNEIGNGALENYYNSCTPKLDANKMGNTNLYINTFYKKDKNMQIVYIKELRGKIYIKDVITDFYNLNKTLINEIGIAKKLFQNKNNDCVGPLFGEIDNIGLKIKSKTKIIDGNDYFSIFLIENGKVYGSGWNKNGELGSGEYNLNKKYFIPINISICVNKISKIVCGNDYVLALNDLGYVYGWGKNNKSQLGLGITKDFYEPVHVKSLSNVINIYAGYDHSACIVNNNFYSNNESEEKIECGDLYIWGNAESGKVGLGNEYIQGFILLPRKINLAKKIYKCSLGTSHSLFLTENNELYVCGNTNNGRLGISNAMEYKKEDNAEKKVSEHISILSYPKQVKLNEEIYIKDILAGSTYSIILSIDGFIYICGEFVKNKIFHKSFTLYNQISNIKMIVGKYQHVLFLTYDNKIFGLGDNSYFQILNNNQKETYLESPTLVPYFLKHNVEQIYSFKNVSFAQLSNNDMYGWGYSKNGHLGIGLKNLVYIKNPINIIKTWVGYEEEEYGNEADNIEGGIIDNEDMFSQKYNIYTNWNEINMIKKKIINKERFNNYLVYQNYYEEQIERFIFQVQNLENIISWEYIQILLKSEEYNNSLNYIKNYEKDLIDLYTKHMKFLLNLQKFEKKYNDLYINLQNYILSHIAYMKEPLPNIMYTNNTHIFDSNRKSVENFIYILQQQPLYLIIMCLIHNHKNVKNLKKIVFEKNRDNTHFDHTIETRPNINTMDTLRHAYDYDTFDERQKKYTVSDIKKKHKFYQNSTKILCSFIFDLYYDLRNKRVLNIFTIFLIKLGIEEMKNCLHIDSLYKIETSIFFTLIRMLFMKNEILSTFSNSIANMNNNNSFVKLLDGMSRKRNPSDNLHNFELTKVSFLDDPKREFNEINSEHLDAYNQNDTNLENPNYIHNNAIINMKNQIEEHTELKNENNKVENKPRNSIKMFVEMEDEEKNKQFLNFIKGKDDDESKKKKYNYDLVNNKKPIMNDHAITETDVRDNFQTEKRQYISGEETNKIKQEEKNVLVEIDFVQVFKELCKIFEKIDFPEIFKVIIKYLFKYFCIYEKNINKEENNKQTNKIYFVNDDLVVYLPFFNLTIMGVILPILSNIQKVSEKYYYPPIPVHIVKTCDRICDFIQILYLNKFESLNSYNLKNNFISVKYIFENTFNSFTHILNKFISNTKYDIYANLYIDLFHYHLDTKPYFVQLKLFQLSHIFNLFFRFQNYIALSFDDPIIKIVNLFYKYKRDHILVKESEKCRSNQRNADSKPTHTEINNIQNGVYNEKKYDMPSNKERETLPVDPIKNNAPLTNIMKEKKKLLYNLIKKPKKGKDNVEKEDKQRVIEINKNINNSNQHTNVEKEIKCYKPINNDPKNCDIQNSNHIGRKKNKKLIFDEIEIEFFIKCKLIYNFKIDTRFLLTEKNMTICQFTRIPMPQYMAYRKSGCIENNEYIFSFIHNYNCKKDNVYIISECFKNCPLFEDCDNTDSLLLKLKELKTYYVSLQEQDEVNLVHLIKKVIDIFVSDEMIYVDFFEEFPPNLYIKKFKYDHIEKSKYDQEYLVMIQNTYDKDTFFKVKWRNIAIQLAINILKKKKHMNYLKKLYEQQEEIEQLILNYKYNMKKNMNMLKNSLIFVSKLLIEKPILVNAIRFKKNLYFIKLKKEKDFLKLAKSNYAPYDISTVRSYPIQMLINNSLITNINNLLKPVLNYLTIEVHLCLDNIIKLDLVLNKNQNRSTISNHMFISTDIYTMYNGSPFLSYPLFNYNKTHLCLINGFNFVHLLHDLIIDLY
ncbi:guanidine nucleotide exchange factor, putative [Plasmodium vinckei brucechwatti]|uniref:Guanidine nucleotide exchange factor, putative n=1 Tax=Plasmodium vinckei brucechwatti TaxID=119398 RepID=A0A6V7SBQ1_PLAVN|nr:guanidine nucleotide exchange factor, putative [Plasmodium vinckei brucechwatti]